MSGLLWKVMTHLISVAGESEKPDDLVGSFGAEFLSEKFDGKSVAARDNRALGTAEKNGHLRGWDVAFDEEGSVIVRLGDACIGKKGKVFAERGERA